MEEKVPEENGAEILSPHFDVIERLNPRTLNALLDELNAARFRRFAMELPWNFLPRRKTDENQ